MECTHSVLKLANSDAVDWKTIEAELLRFYLDLKKQCSSLPNSLVVTPNLLTLSDRAQSSKPSRAVAVSSSPEQIRGDSEQKQSSKEQQSESSQQPGLLQSSSEIAVSGPDLAKEETSNPQLHILQTPVQQMSSCSGKATSQLAVANQVVSQILLPDLQRKSLFLRESYMTAYEKVLQLLEGRS